MLADILGKLIPRAQSRELRSGQFLFRQGDRAEYIFALEQGQIILTRYLSNGRSVPMHAARAGQTFTEAALFSDIYLTGDLLSNIPGIQPCPVCLNGTCNGGPRNGLPCTPADSASLGTAYPTSHDCPPPPSLFIGSLGIPFSLSTGTQTKTSVDLPAQQFVFCGFCANSVAFQNPPVPCTSDTNCSAASGFPTCRQRTAGAFGQTARTITETGAPAGVCIADGAAHNATEVSVFCIPPSFNATADAAGDLPGPGAVALPGQTTFLP